MKGLSEAAGDRVSLLWGTAGLGLASHGLGLDSELQLPGCVTFGCCFPFLGFVFPACRVDGYTSVIGLP